MQFAYGNANFEKHIANGFFDMFINSQTGDVFSGGASLLETSDYLLHGILLYISWGAFIII